MLPLPHDARAPRAYLAALAAWLVAALVLAWLRVPYDDEWFSLDAAALSHPELLRTLARDLHPPWVAHLDWLIAHATSERLALQLPRLAASALAIHLLSQTLGRRTGLGPTLVALACFHPLVLFYGGAIRWYPFVFLAQAARLWALSGTAPEPRRELAFVLGGLGPAAGYIDGLFLLHDCVWWVPVGAGMHPSLLDLLTWLGMGLVGPAHPEWPWWIAAVLVPVAMLAGWRCLWRTERPGPLGWWLVTTLAVWAAAAAVMFVWSPRYSLLLWPIATLGIVRLAARHRGPPRILGLAAVGYLAVVTAHVYAGTGSLKSDLDDLDPTVCAELAHADLVLAGSRPRAPPTEGPSSR